MKKLLLRTGLLTVGSVSLLANDVKLYAKAFENYRAGETIEEFNSEEYKLINHYANIFEIDATKTYEKIKEITKDFTDFEVGVKTINENHSGYDYRLKYKINDTIYDNKEMAILDVVRDIYRNPEEYNLSYEDLDTDYEYEPTKCAEEIIEYYAKPELIGTNKYIAASIMYAECGTDLSSDNYLENHNPAGLGPFNYYRNIEQGIISYLYILKYDYNCTEYSDSSKFDIIGHTYCTEGTETWLSNTKSFYYNIIDDYYCYARAYGRKEDEFKKNN